MKAAIEGLIFISGDEGITKEQLLSILEISKEELEVNLQELINDYAFNERGTLNAKFSPPLDFPW